MTRIPKLKRWEAVHTWTGAKCQVDAPTQLLAKMNAAHAMGVPIQWYGEFTVRLLKDTPPVLRLS